MEKERARKPGRARGRKGGLAFILGLLLLVLAAPPGRAGPEEKAAPEKSNQVNRFPDYQPKLTPDTVRDYRPGLAPRLEALPPATLKALPRLLAALAQHQAQAREEPGRWREGNIVLGADPQEYCPSDPELIASEIGSRIQKVVAGASRGAVQEVLDQAGITAREIEFDRIEFRHVDVMGSGRFFYAGPLLRTRVPLTRP